ncbi:hypothetical protein CRYUN_Cryun21dG0104500 [Craigia yunnanensis]
MDPVNTWGNSSLESVDPEINDLNEKEKRRQCRGIELIASENFTSFSVIEALGSALTNIYSEGIPGIVTTEATNSSTRLRISAELALCKLFISTPPSGVSMYSLTRVPRQTLPLTRLFSSLMIGSWHSIYPLAVNSSTGYIDYDKLEENALDFRPKLIICGGSAYPRDWDYARFKAVADKCGALLLCDMAHISGLVAAQEAANPFEFCDIVTTTTHKSLRGPRAGMIFYRKGPKPPKKGQPEDAVYDFEDKINFAVFPSL